MNRNERRKQDLEFKKNKEIIEKLTPSQTKVLDLVATEKAKYIADDYIKRFGDVLDTNFSAAMLENGFKLDLVDKILTLTGDLTIEHMEKINNLEKAGNVEMVVKKMEMDARKEIERLMDLGETKTKLINEVLFKFPSISKSMAINAYAKIKEARASKETDPDIEDAMEKVADILGEDGKEVKKVLKQVEKIKVEEVAIGKTIEGDSIAEIVKNIPKTVVNVTENADDTPKTAENITVSANLNSVSKLADKEKPAIRKLKVKT